MLEALFNESKKDQYFANEIKKGSGVNQNPLVSLFFSSPALPGSDSGSIFSDYLKPPPQKELNTLYVTKNMPAGISVHKIIH